MACDDMHVLIYKALAYLYSCMRKGTAPDRAALSCDGMVFGGVPEAHWAAIWAEMIERGLVRGASILWADNERSVIPRSASWPASRTWGFTSRRRNKHGSNCKHHQR